MQTRASTAFNSISKEQPLQPKQLSEILFVNEACKRQIGLRADAEIENTSSKQLQSQILTEDNWMTSPPETLQDAKTSLIPVGNGVLLNASDFAQYDHYLMLEHKSETTNLTQLLTIEHRNVGFCSIKLQDPIYADAPPLYFAVTKMPFIYNNENADLVMFTDISSTQLMKLLSS